MNYTKYYNTRRTPQTQAIPGRNQVKNNAGGYVSAISAWDQLDRFLILGSSGGTYYVGEQKLTLDNAKNVRKCIDEDGIRTVTRIVEISEGGRAPKNDEALFALAMCVAFGNQETRKFALGSLHRVARIGTHLIQFVHFVTSMSKWNRSLRNAIARWYNEKSPEDVAYQVLKYQSRTVEQGVPSSAWTQRDILRLSHPRPATSLHSDVFKWAIHGWEIPEAHSEREVSQIWAYEMAKRATKESEIISLIGQYRLTREMIPTNWLNSVAVWEALLERMPLTAMVRNLGKMTSVGLLKPLSNASSVVCSRLNNQEYLKRSRVHPLSVLVATRTYAQGSGMRGKLSWSPVSNVIDALDDAFYLSFDNVEPSGKRICLALDVSGSMSVPIAGLPLSAREATAAMALVTARTEPNYYITAFSHRLVPFNISPKMRLDDVVKKAYDLDFGSTDCSLPMTTALSTKTEIDAFVIYTDSETYYGNIHPVQALEEYRRRMGINAKFIVVATTSTGFSIADPNDMNSLDIAGFDTATPNVISNFIAD